MTIRNKYHRAYKRVMSAFRSARRMGQGADGYTVGVYQGGDYASLAGSPDGFEFWYGPNKMPTRVAIALASGPTPHQLKKMVSYICR